MKAIMDIENLRTIESLKIFLEGDQTLAFEVLSNK